MVLNENMCRKHIWHLYWQLLPLLPCCGYRAYQLCQHYMLQGISALLSSHAVRQTSSVVITRSKADQHCCHNVLLGISTLSSSCFTGHIIIAVISCCRTCQTCKHYLLQQGISTLLSCGASKLTLKIFCAAWHIINIFILCRKANHVLQDKPMMLSLYAATK